MALDGRQVHRISAMLKRMVTKVVMRSQTKIISNEAAPHAFGHAPHSFVDWTSDSPASQPFWSKSSRWRPYKPWRRQFNNACRKLLLRVGESIVSQHDYRNLRASIDDEQKIQAASVTYPLHHISLHHNEFAPYKTIQWTP